MLVYSTAYCFVSFSLFLDVFVYWCARRKNAAHDYGTEGKGSRTEKADMIRIMRKNEPKATAMKKKITRFMDPATTIYAEIGGGKMIS